MTSHPGLWMFLEQLIENFIKSIIISVQQMNEGHNPREANRRARVERAEKQILLEDKLTNNQWTATKGVFM
jgi:hypothetical protein